jgi:hypothetical protein
MENDQETSLYQKYLKPSKDPHIRIGTSYQAKIPEQQDHKHDHNQYVHSTDITIEKHITINEDIDDLVKPSKKRRLDI